MEVPIADIPATDGMDTDVASVMQGRNQPVDGGVQGIAMINRKGSFRKPKCEVHDRHASSLTNSIYTGDGSFSAITKTPSLLA